MGTLSLALRVVDLLLPMLVSMLLPIPRQISSPGKFALPIEELAEM